MSGLGQFGNAGDFAWNSQTYNMNRKPGAPPVGSGANTNTNTNNLQSQQNKPKRQGMFGEDEEGESSLFFNNQNMFRSDKELLSSPSPSQLSQPFGSSSLYVPSLGLNSVSAPQRGMTTNSFQRNSTPTTSIYGALPINLPPQQPGSPNRNLFSSIQNRGGLMNPMQSQQGSTQSAIGNQLKRSNPLSAAFGSSSTTTASFSSISSAFGRPQDGGQPSLDLSEFPTLGNRSSLPPNPMPSTRNYGTVIKQSQEAVPEFQIQQEDFPALPGAQSISTSAANDNMRKTPTSTSESSYESVLSKEGARFPGDRSSSSQPKRGIQTQQDGTVSNIPAGMVTDQFGMVGLLTFIRAAETDSNLVALAPGIDLTTLGLNLNSPENLYSTFQSPWADQPCRPQDIDFHVPPEYLTNVFIREKLAPIKLNRYGDDLLIYLFYMNGGDVLQLAAAAELYTRNWRYHKEEKVWIIRAPGMEPVVKTNTYERGTYYFFDSQNWRKVPKEFLLEYDKLEERPHLPPNFPTPQA